MTIELYLERISSEGKPAHRGFTFTDKRYNKDNIIITQFIHHLRVDEALIIKHEIENLESIIHFKDNNIDCTEQILPEFITTFQKLLGKLQITDKRTKKEKGALKYMEKYLNIQGA